MTDDLMQKLMVSKAIMDKHNNIPRNSGAALPMNINIPDEEMPQNVRYNIPEQKTIQEPPRSNSLDKIKQSKLPDSIKQLMIEHPIEQQKPNQNTLSDEFVEKASRLMNAKQKKSDVKESNVSIDYELIKKIIKETVEEALKENSLLIENVQATNDVFSFKVGKHIFEGKVTKVKKLK
jgi:hypothetical protein